MRHCKLLLLFIATCLIIIPIQSSGSVNNSGQDGNIEWKNLGNWQVEGRPIDMVPSLDGKYFYILTESGEVFVYDKRGNLQGRIPVDEGVTSIGVAPQGQLLYLMDENKHLVSIMSVNFVVNIDISGSPFRGPAAAPVTIAVYADFE